MPVYFDSTKKRWRYTFNRVVAGSRARYTKLLPKGWGRSQAEKWGDQETARLYAVATGLERPEPTIGQGVALYLEHRVPKLRGGRKITQDLAQLIDYIEGKPMSALAQVSLDYAKDHPELAEGTLHNRLAYLKAACRHAWKRHKLTQHDPTAQMVVPRPNNERQVQVPVGRVEGLLRSIQDDETRALYTLAFRTGTRWIKGILPRRPEDVVRAGRDVWLQIGVTKNGTARMKWVHPDARWALAHLPFRYGATYYYDRFCAARAAVGFPGGLDTPGGLVAHDMRHVVATDIRMRGKSLEDVGAALDHDSYQASQRYAHIAPAQVKRVLAEVGGKRRKRRKAA